ncbi:MAG: class I SAM-dependent methyltransferase [Candidatus Methylomirabilia bacterium]
MTGQHEALDEAKVKAFTQRMVSHFTGASISLMIEVGRQAGLFEAMAPMPPATSAAIAGRTGLTERYVREWLGAMVCGGIVEYDPAARTYCMPPEHAVLLTGHSSRNLTSLAAMFPLLMRGLPDVVEAFRRGGGVPYATFQPDFTGLMDARSRPRYDEFLLTKYLGSSEGLIARLEEGIRVADVGCGTGYCVNFMAKRFPRSTFVGYDLSETAIERARTEAATTRAENATFVVEDVTKLPAEPKFDLITAFDAIHDQVDPAGVLRRIRAALAPGGRFVMLDVHASSNLEDNVDMPFSPFLYTISTMHCLTVSLAHGGAGLGTVWGRQLATRMLHEAGFGEVQLFERVDPLNSLYVAR